MNPQTWRRLLMVRESRILSAERAWRAAAQAARERREGYERAQAQVMEAYRARCRVDEDWALARRSLDTFSRDDCLSLAGEQGRAQEALERQMVVRDDLAREMAVAEEREREARRKLRDAKAAATKTDTVYERALSHERCVAAVQEEQELDELAVSRPVGSFAAVELGSRT